MNILVGAILIIVFIMLVWRLFDKVWTKVDSVRQESEIDYWKREYQLVSKFQNRASRNRDHTVITMKRLGKMYGVNPLDIEPKIILDFKLNQCSDIELDIMLARFEELILAEAIEYNIHPDDTSSSYIHTTILRFKMNRYTAEFLNN